MIPKELLNWNTPIVDLETGLASDWVQRLFREVTAIPDDDTMSLRQIAPMTPGVGQDQLDRSNVAMLAVSPIVMPPRLPSTPTLIANPAANFNIYTLGAGLYRGVRTFSDTQIKAFPTTTIAITHNPGAGLAAVATDCRMWFDYTANYTNIQATAAMGLCYSSSTGNNALGLLREAGAINKVSQLLAATADSFARLSVLSGALLQPASNYTAGAQVDGGLFVANNALHVFITNAASGDLTGGNSANILKVAVDYTIFDLT